MSYVLALRAIIIRQVHTADVMKVTSAHTRLTTSDLGRRRSSGQGRCNDSNNQSHIVILRPVSRESYVLALRAIIIRQKHIPYVMKVTSPHTRLRTSDLGRPRPSGRGNGQNNQRHIVINRGASGEGVHRPHEAFDDGVGVFVDQALGDIGEALLAE